MMEKKNSVSEKLSLERRLIKFLRASSPGNEEEALSPLLEYLRQTTPIRKKKQEAIAKG
ncbi:hypothetical protein [Mucilaginibacter sp. SP1R1]|uniref:hypothetical protein n=1 Tax=Mucilaginibacter sp. SP1R1 TaxID=2723091 RepID=UPI003B0034A9